MQGARLPRGHTSTHSSSCMQGQCPVVFDNKHIQTNRRLCALGTTKHQHGQSAKCVLLKPATCAQSGCSWSPHVQSGWDDSASSSSCSHCCQPPASACATALTALASAMRVLTLLTAPAAREAAARAAVPAAAVMPRASVQFWLVFCVALCPVAASMAITLTCPSTSLSCSTVVAGVYTGARCWRSVRSLRKCKEGADALRPYQ